MNRIVKRVVLIGVLAMGIASMASAADVPSTVTNADAVGAMASTNAPTVIPLDPQDMLQNFVAHQAAAHPWIVTALWAMAALRLLFKPLMGRLEVIAKERGKLDQIQQFEASGIFKVICWVLDFGASIKVPVVLGHFSGGGGTDGTSGTNGTNGTNAGKMVGLLLVLGLGMGLAGCMTKKVVTTSPSGVVVTNTIVNTNNLILDCAVIKGASAYGVSIALQKDPTLREPLQDTQTALDGVLNGINPLTSKQVLELCGADGNQVIADQITPLIAMASGLEQDLLARYGGQVGPQIAIAITRALDDGFKAGLGGSK